jgi:flagellar biosynthesis/type III secretory pathway M-ring protein FliF/YscJ
MKDWWRCMGEEARNLVGLLITVAIVIVAFLLVFVEKDDG